MSVSSMKRKVLTRFFFVVSFLVSLTSCSTGTRPRKGLFDRKRSGPTVNDDIQAVPTSPPIHTCMGDLVDVFGDGLLINRKEHQASVDISLPKLLTACRKFESEMRRVGQLQNAKDLSGNISKVEDSRRKAPSQFRDHMFSLLKYEKGLGVHSNFQAESATSAPPQRRLQDPSGAMGLLWIQRCLSFNYKLYARVVDNPKDMTTVEAALSAYRSVLEPFHGRILRNLYQYAIRKTTPPRRPMLAQLGGFGEVSAQKNSENENHSQHKFTLDEENATVSDLRRLLDVWRPLISEYRRIFDELDLDDNRRV